METVNDKFMGGHTRTRPVLADIAKLPDLASLHNCIIETNEPDYGKHSSLICAGVADKGDTLECSYYALEDGSHAFESVARIRVDFLDARHEKVIYSFAYLVEEVPNTLKYRIDLSDAGGLIFTKTFKVIERM